MDHLSCGRVALPSKAFVTAVRSRPCGRCDRRRDEREEGPSKRHELNRPGQRKGGRDRSIDRRINGHQRQLRVTTLGTRSPGHSEPA